MHLSCSWLCWDRRSQNIRFSLHGVNICPRLSSQSEIRWASLVDYSQKFTHFSDSHASFWSVGQDKEGKLQHWFETFKRGSEKERTDDSYFWAHTWVPWLCRNRQYIVLQRSSSWRYVLSKAQANCNRIWNLKMIFSLEQYNHFNIICSSSKPRPKQSFWSD